jgi:hypothetical protein
MGVDPGTTTAVAVLDTSGRLLMLFSRKGLTRAEISRRVLRAGKPVIVAADRRPAPGAVAALAVMFSANLSVPEENLSRKEKNRLAREFPFTERKPNQHERDAMSSAVFALNAIKPTMRRVDLRLRQLGLSGDDSLERFVKTRVILNGDHVKRAVQKYRS